MNKSLESAPAFGNDDLFISSVLGDWVTRLEAGARIELANKGFAILRRTTEPPCRNHAALRKKGVTRTP